MFVERYTVGARKRSWAMATKKKGVLTTSGEWARHLRPLLKRVFWKAERRAARRDASRRLDN